MSRSVAFVALVATGCASIAPQRGHDEVAKLVRDRTGESTGWEQGPAADDATHQRVTELLQGGLDPRRAVAIALLHNPRLLATYEELGISQADLVQAGLLKNPSFSVAAGWPVSGGRIVEQQFSLVQDFLDLFVLPLRRDLAAEQFAGDVARVAHEAYAVATETLAAFITCQAAAKNVELRTTLLEAQVASLTLAERQFEAGNITELALTTERAVAAQARLDVSVAEQALFASREAVNRALGLFGPQTDWGLRAELSDLPEADPSLEHLETLAMHQRLDVAAARRQVRVFEQHRC